MRIVSWNVNGVRAAMNKGFRSFVQEHVPDVVCLQETKAEPHQVDVTWAEALGYRTHWNAAEKKGYSGTSIWTRIQPEKISFGIGCSDHDREGRVITATFEDFHLVNVYTPNSQRGLTRLEYRLQWDRAFLQHITTHNRGKPVIFCGDINCSHHEIDLAHPKSNRNNAGFTDAERAGLDRIEAAGFIDSFRKLNDGPGHYTWWTYRSDARVRNVGWRLDYFWVAAPLWDRVADARIRGDVLGSDHCPVELTLT